MPYVQLKNGLKVHYEQVGNGPDMVMIHGVIGNMGVWHFKIVPMLWDEYRMLTYDLRGHGHTELTETGYTPTLMAADLLELLDALEIDKVFLVGHSYGADVALYFTYLYPERVRSAVLIEPLVPALYRMATKGDLERKEWLAKTIDLMGVDLPEERKLDQDYMLNMAFKTATRWGPRKNMARSRQHKEWAEKLFTKTSVLKDILEVGPLTIDQIPTIQTPIHLVFDSGSIMWRRSYRHLKSHLPNVTTGVLRTKAGEMPHFAPLEKPEFVVRQIRAAFSPAVATGAATS